MFWSILKKGGLIKGDKCYSVYRPDTHKFIVTTMTRIELYFAMWPGSRNDSVPDCSLAWLPILSTSVICHESNDMTRQIIRRVLVWLYCQWQRLEKGRKPSCLSPPCWPADCLSKSPRSRVLESALLLGIGKEASVMECSAHCHDFARQARVKLPPVIHCQVWEGDLL